MLKKKSKKILKINSLIKILVFILLIACSTNIKKVVSKTKILIYQPNKKSKNIEKNNALLVDIKWQKISKDNQKNIIWRKYINEKNLSKPSSSNKKINQKKKFEISSFNRSIIFNHNTVGPDINWLIPPGLKWNNRYKLDFLPIYY